MYVIMSPEMCGFHEETRLIPIFSRARVNYLWRWGACARCKSAAAGSSCRLYRFECITLHGGEQRESTNDSPLMLHTGFTSLSLYVYRAVPSYLSSARYLSNLTPSSREDGRNLVSAYPLMAAYSFSTLFPPLLFALPSSLSIFTSYLFLQVFIILLVSS